MATVSGSLALFGAFAELANQAGQGMERVLRAVRQVRQEMEAPVSLRVELEAQDVVREAALARAFLGVMFDTVEVKLEYSIDVHDIAAQARVARTQLLDILGRIEANLQLEMTSSVEGIFSNLQHLVNRLLESVGELNKASGDTRQLEEALRRIAALEEKINGANVGTNQERDKGEKKSKGLLDNLKGSLSQLVSIDNLSKAVDFVRWSESIAAVNSRLGQINDGTQTQQQLQQKVMAASNETRRPYQETAQMVTQLGVSNNGTFKDNNSIIAFTSRFNKLMMASGASTEDTTSAGQKVTESFGSGKLGGDDLQDLINTAPLLSKVLADGMGVARGSLQKLADDGKLTSAAIVKAFAKQDSYINGIFTKMPVTFDQAMTVAKNKAAEWVSQLNGANGPIQQVTDSIMKLISWLDTDQGQGLLNGLTIGIQMVSDAVAAGVAFLIDHMDIVKNVLLAAGIVVMGLAVYWTIMWVAALWPLFAVVAGITLLILMLREFGVSTQQIVSYVIGIFGAMFAAIWNGVALVWNFFLSFAEFFVNLFIDPIYAVKKLFYDLAMTFMGSLYNMLRSGEDFAGGFMKVILEGINGAIGGINWLLKAISKIPGVGDLGEIKLFETDNVHAVSDGLKRMMDSIPKPTTDKNVVDLSKYRMKDKNVNDVFNSSKQYGSSLFEKGAAGLDTFKQKGDAWSNQKALSDINKVNEVGKINDSVDVSSEDLKTMRELAEMKNIQNFVTLQPSLSFGDTHVRQDGRSVDEIIANISDRLHEQIASSAQGVYG